MKRILDTMQVPPGGWRYREPETGVELTSNNFLALMQDVRKHRDANGLPTFGDWSQQVHDCICQQNPQTPCEEVGSIPSVVTADDIWRFIETMWELKGSELVSEQEQARRIDICLQCPKRGVVACRWCGRLAGKITELLGGRTIHKVDQIFKTSCMACKCDLTAKTAIPLDVLKRVDEKLGGEPDYHEKCWMRE